MDLIGWVQQGVQNAINAVIGGGQQAATVVQNAAGNAINTGSQIIQNGGTVIGNTINQAGNAVGNTYNQGIQNLSSGLQYTTVNAGNIAGTSIQGIQGIPNMAITGMGIIGSGIGSGVQYANTLVWVNGDPLKEILGITGMGAQGLPQSSTGQPAQQMNIPNSPFMVGDQAIGFMNSVNPASQANTGITLYVPFGDRAQTEVKNLNSVIYDPVSGAFEGSVVPFGHSISNIVTSGGAGSLQSGMFSTKPETPIVYTQEGTFNKIYAPTAHLDDAASILANPSAYSRLGAEAYGGTVSLLDGRTLGDAAMGVYSAASGNLANLVNPTGVNQPKSTWAELPWNAPVMSTPGFYKVESPGTIGTYLTPISTKEMASIGITPPVTLEQKGTPIGGASLPTPFISSIGSSSGNETYVQKNDPLTVFLEATQQAGDTLLEIFAPLTGGKALTPGSDQLAKYGQTGSPIVDDFNKNMAGVQSEKPEMDKLASQITGERSTLDAMTAGKLNAQGQFTGTAAEYSAYKDELTKLNADIGTYDAYGKQVDSVIKGGFASGAILPSGDKGGYMINPDLARPYGAWSDFTTSLTRTVRGGTTEAQIANYEQSDAFKNGGLANAWGEGSWKAATNPVGLAKTGLQFAEMYVGMGLIGGAFAALAPAAEVATILEGGEIAAPVVPTTLLETIGATGTRIMASPYFQGGLGAAFLGAGVLSATNWFTNPATTSMSNLGGMTINTAAGIATIGGLEYGAPAITRAGVEFSDRISVIDRATVTQNWQSRPDVSVASGVGGELSTTVTQQHLAPYTINVAGYDVPIFPRIRTPEPTTFTIHDTGIDIGTMFGTRLEGTLEEPTVGSRVVNMELRSSAFRDTLFPSGEEGALYPGQMETAHGTGDVRISSVRLPNTITDYVEMGSGRDIQRATGLSQEEITATLMDNAAQYTTPQAHFRTLDVVVPRDTNIFEAFGYDFGEGTGTAHEFTRLENGLEGYVGSRSVSQTGAAPYTINVVKDITEEGMGNTGNYEVTGSQTPEAKIISQLQEVSRNTVPNTPEHGFGFDSRGNLVVEEVGQSHAIDMFGIKETIAGEPGDVGYLAHSHPTQEFNIRNVFDTVREDIINNRDISFGITRDMIRWEFGGRRAAEALPSRNVPDPITGQLHGDINAMASNDFLALHGVRGRIGGEYIVSARGVTIFHPDDMGSWDAFQTVVNLPPIPVDIENPLGVIDVMSGATGADMSFVENTDRVITAGYSERTVGATADMQSAIPQGPMGDFVRGLNLDFIDRGVLKNPSLEFRREPGIGATPREPSLLESGSNLGRGRVGYSSPLAIQEEKQIPQSSFRQSFVEPGAEQQILPKTERVFVGEPSITDNISRLESGAESMSMLIPAVMSGRESVMSTSPMVAQLLVPQQESRVKQDNVLSYVPMSDTVQASRTDLDKILAVSPISDLGRISDQERVVVFDVVPAFDIAQKSDTQQVPIQQQVPIVSPAIITMPVITQIPPTDIVPPQKPLPPVIPIPGIPWLPGFGGGGGGGGGIKGPRYKQVETFYLGPKNLAGLMGKAPKTKLPKMRKK